MAGDKVVLGYGVVCRRWQDILAGVAMLELVLVWQFLVWQGLEERRRTDGVEAFREIVVSGSVVQLLSSNCCR